MWRPASGRVLPVLALLAAVLAACSTPPVAPVPEQPTPRPSPVVQPRARDAAPIPIGAPQPVAGLFFRVELPGLADDADLIHAEPGRAVQGRVMLANYSLFGGFRVVCLVDYRQVSCVPGPLQLDMGEERAIPLTLPAQSPGLHQVLVLLFEAPDLHSDEASFRANSRFMVSARRAWLRAGPSDALAESPAPPKVVSAMTRAARQGFAVFQVSPGRRPLDLGAEEWLIARSGPDVALDYTAMVTNPRQSSVDFLLLPFLDYAVQPEAGGQTYFRVRQLSGAASTLTLRGRLTPGPHEFQALAISSPYSDRTGLGGRSPRDSVSAAARVLIFVDR